MNRIRIDGGIAAIGEMFADTPHEVWYAWEALEAVEALPDASGEFTGYLVPPAWYEDYFAGVNALDYLDGFTGDACSPDTNQHYPF